MDLVADGVGREEPPKDPPGADKVLSGFSASPVFPVVANQRERASDLRIVSYPTPWGNRSFNEQPGLNGSTSFGRSAFVEGGANVLARIEPKLGVRLPGGIEPADYGTEGPPRTASCSAICVISLLQAVVKIVFSPVLPSPGQVLFGLRLRISA